MAERCASRNARSRAAAFEGALFGGDRPVLGRHSQDNRLAVTLGCSIEHASKIVYAQPFRIGDPDLITPIGINCRLCPRQHCSQRAHQPVHLELPIDEHRRGETRFES